MTMGLFGRYLFRQTAAALILILVSLTTLAWIVTALKSLDIVTTDSQQALTFLKVTALALPNLMAIIAPIALLVSALHVLFRANSDSELIVMTAGGAPVWHFAKPMLVLAALVSVFVLIMNLLVMPWSVRTLNFLIGQLRADLIGQVLQPGKFSSADDKRIFHIRARDPKTQELRGLVMHDASEKGQELTYLAERGNIVKDGANAFLVMEQGHILRRTESELAPRIFGFDSYAIDLIRLQPVTGAPQLRPRERYLHELLDPPDKDEPYYKNNEGKMRSELHERFAGALYPFVFVLIAVAGVGQARTNRQARVNVVLVTFATAAAVRLGGFAANNLATLKPSAVGLVYGLPVMAIVLALVKAYLAMVPRSAPAFVRRLEGLDLGVRLAALVRRRPGALTRRRPA